MKTTLLSSMGSFVLGTGATLVALSTWLGSGDLQEIKSLVQNHMVDTEQQVSAFVEDYQVQIDTANAEIGQYQAALAQANDNISQLVVAYEDKVAELENANQQAEQDLADLEQALADMQTRLDSQYETDMNAIIEQANEQINQANQEVAETKEYIEEEVLPTSQIDEIIKGAQEYDKVNTDGDKTVQDISSVVPAE